MKQSQLQTVNNWFLITAVLLFFFNTTLLNGKLTLALLLTPVWIYLSSPIRAGISRPAFYLFVIILFWIPVHYYFGVADTNSYIISFLIIVSLILFINVAAFYIRKNVLLLDRLFRILLVLTGLLTLCSLVLLYIPALKPLVWYTISISEDIEPLPRLKLFTTEASHFSLIFSPVFIYFMIRLMHNRIERPWLIAIFTILPVILSFSLGVIAALSLSGIFVLLYGYRVWFSEWLTGKKIILLGTGLVFLMTALYFFYPDNPLYTRIYNLFHGLDTSGRGRTYEAFILADKIVNRVSSVFGIGPGQLKTLGRDIIIQYYYYFEMPEVVRIPNALAETIVYYGYAGFMLRISTLIFLFFKTRVWINPFRLWLFLFLFIYQFTGSYFTNPSEYLLWLLAFLPVFGDLDKKSI